MAKSYLGFIFLACFGAGCAVSSPTPPVTRTLFPVAVVTALDSTVTPTLEPAAAPTAMPSQTAMVSLEAMATPATVLPASTASLQPPAPKPSAAEVAAPGVVSLPTSAPSALSATEVAAPRVVSSPTSAPSALSATEVAAPGVVSSPTAAPSALPATEVAAPGVVSSPTAAPPALSTEVVAPEVAAAEQHTIDLINTQRAAAGLGPLVRDETLMRIARARVADMVARHYTGHYDPVTGEGLGKAMMHAAGYTTNFMAENFYGNAQGPLAAADVAMAWFMTDPPHADNILNTHFAGVGVGIAFNGKLWLLVQDFAGQ